MTDHFQQVYSHQAADYHQLVIPEDVDNNIRPAIERVTSLRGKRILDLGTGSGRLPLFFGRQAAQMVGLDLHWDMLREHRAQQQRVGGQWGLVQGDMRILPFPSGWAEVVMAGWATGHFTGWSKDKWQSQIGRVLREMHRLASPTGSLIILETLTTGSLTPAPPTEALAKYYAWLENEWGFSRQEISTDYQFASVEEAVARTEFFFGPAGLSDAIREQGWARLPEWTGVWGKRLADGG